MTRGRMLALSVGVPLALVVIGWTALTAVAYAGQASYPVRLDLPVHGGTVRVAVDSGDVTAGQAAGDRLRLTGTARYSLVRSTVTWHSTPSGVTVSSQCHFVTGVCSFKYQAAFPAGLRAFVSDGSGDVTLQGLAAPVHAVDQSGDVHAYALAGAVNIQDRSGDVHGAALSGRQVVLHDQSGDIIVSGLTSRDVTASGGSGDVTLIFTKVPDRVRISDQSGNVTLVLPRGGTLYDVTASTSSGQTGVHVPTSSSSPHEITVTDQSGNITIARGS